MDQPVFAGRLFKNDKGPWGAILIYVLLALIVVLLATIAFVENTTIQWIAGGALVVVIVAIGISRKLTFNEPDDKNIYIGVNGIAIGTEQYDWNSMDKVGIYVDAYYGFRYKVTGAMGAKTFESSYGMDNWFYFRTGDKKHSYRFVIPNHESYFLLEDILSYWRNEGRNFAWKEKYGRTYIESGGRQG